MSQFDSNKDYYGVLGVDKDASQVEIERQYKRQASKASSGSRRQRRADEVFERSLRRSQRQVAAQFVRRFEGETCAPPGFVRVTTPTARDVGVLVTA
jgi:ribosomal protein L44E